MRFYPKNVEELYNIVPVGTSVYMINEIVKIGWNGDQLMMEVHGSLEEDNLTREDIINKAHAALAPYQSDESIQLVNKKAFEASVDQMSGIPVEIGRKKGSEIRDERVINEFDIKAPMQLISQ
jgi:L,D-transpeptidase ErfK/SrfK